MPKSGRAATVFTPHITSPYVHQAPIATKTNKKWSSEDDDRLRKAKATGKPWDQLARQYFPGKSATACRKRYERAMRAQMNGEWGGERRADFAQAYSKHKEQMWSRVAQELGEPKKDWRIFEAKAFELGLKGLEVVERFAKRDAERGLDSGTTNDDSGIGLSDTEHDIRSYHAAPTVRTSPAYAGPSFQQGPFLSHGGYDTRGRLSVNSMLSPSPSARGLA